MLGTVNFSRITSIPFGAVSQNRTIQFGRVVSFSLTEIPQQGAILDRRGRNPNRQVLLERLPLRNALPQRAVLDKTTAERLALLRQLSPQFLNPFLGEFFDQVEIRSDADKLPPEKLTELQKAVPIAKKSPLAPLTLDITQ